MNLADLSHFRDIRKVLLKHKNGIHFYCLCIIEWTELLKKDKGVTILLKPLSFTLFYVGINDLNQRSPRNGTIFKAKGYEK